MRFCLDISHHAWISGSTGAPEATLATIRVADEAGFDSVWLSEDPDGWDAFAVLGAATRETRQVRLGTGVTNPFMRHPNLLAMSVATIDRLSGGRAFLGLGRGQPEWYQRRLGIATGNPVTSLGEAIDLLHQWWREPHVASAGGHFQVHEWSRAVAPARPEVPIYLAALGPKALRLAAERADRVLISEFASIPFLTELIPRLRCWREAAGKPWEGFAIFVRTAIEVTDNPEPLLERRKGVIATVNALPGMAQHMVVPGFDVPAIMAQVRAVMHTDEVLAEGGAFIDIRRVADLPAARRLLPTELVDAVSYVGSLETVRAKLQQLVAIGVTHAFLRIPPGSGAEEMSELMARLQP